jgi:hypothetical protein
MKLIVIIFLSQFLFGEDISEFLVQNDNKNFFITQYEYGKMLYKNPRGISCAKCHGGNAKGKLISKFTHIKKKKKYRCNIKSKDITNISKKKFLNKLNPTQKIKKRKFNKSQICEKLVYGNTMPKYFLTKSELDSIFYYITHIKIK